MSCNTCGGNVHPTLLEFRDFVGDQGLTVPIKQRECWAGTDMVVMFDVNGIWHLRHSHVKEWEQAGMGLDTLRTAIQQLREGF